MKSEKALAIFNVLGVISLIAIPVYFYADLPDQVPIHFNFKGEPDNWSGKKMVFFMPLIGTFLCGLLYYLKDKPDLYNYPVPVTEENKAQLFEIGKQMILVLNVLIVLLFNYINFVSIKTGLSDQAGLHPYFGFIFLGFFLVFMGYYIWRFKQVK